MLFKEVWLLRCHRSEGRFHPLLKEATAKEIRLVGTHGKRQFLQSS